MFFKIFRALFRGIRNIATCLDDMYIYSGTFQYHILTKSKMFPRMVDNGLIVNHIKNEIGFPEISLIGHTVKQGYVEPNDAIVSKILNIEPPKSKKHIQSLSSLVYYYAQFILGFSMGGVEATVVLSSLLRKNTKKLSGRKNGKISWTTSKCYSFQLQS